MAEKTMKKLIIIALIGLFCSTIKADTALPYGVIISSTAQEASHVIKAGPGILISVVGYNAGAAQFIQIFNSATVPADAAVPIYSFSVAATSNFSLDVPLSGADFSTGIAISNSSTQPTKTIGGANCWFTAVIR